MKNKIIFVLFLSAIVLCAVVYYTDKPLDDYKATAGQTIAQSTIIVTLAPSPTFAPENKLTACVYSTMRDRLISLTNDDGVIIVHWKIADNLSQSLISHGAKSDVFDVLKTLAGCGMAYDQITFVGMFPLQDEYGVIEDKTVLSVTYTKATVDRIDFTQPGIKADIFNLRNSGIVHRDLE